MVSSSELVRRTRDTSTLVKILIVLHSTAVANTSVTTALSHVKLPEWVGSEVRGYGVTSHVTKTSARGHKAHVPITG